MVEARIVVQRDFRVIVERGVDAFVDRWEQLPLFAGRDFAVWMIGRDAELEALQAAFRRLFDERRLAAVTVARGRRAVDLGTLEQGAFFGEIRDYLPNERAFEPQQRQAYERFGLNETEIDLIVAGTEKGITMVEGGSHQVSEELTSLAEEVVVAAARNAAQAWRRIGSTTNTCCTWRR